MDVSSKVEVVWADNSKTIILPQVRPQAPDATSHVRGHVDKEVPALG